MRIEWKKYFPLGIEYGREMMAFWIGVGISVLYSTGFLWEYRNARSLLFEWDYSMGQSVMIQGVRMEYFANLIFGRFAGFLVMTGAMLVLMVYHYFYHYMDTKSIYLMKRLPNKRELLRRCLFAPVLGIGICVLCAVLLWGIYFWIYMTATPVECIPSGQWQEIWRMYAGN